MYDMSVTFDVSHWSILMFLGLSLLNNEDMSSISDVSITYNTTVLLNLDLHQDLVVLTLVLLKNVVRILTWVLLLPISYSMLYVLP